MRLKTNKKLSLRSKPYRFAKIFNKENNEYLLNANTPMEVWKASNSIPTEGVLHVVSFQLN